MKKMEKIKKIKKIICSIRKTIYNKVSFETANFV